MIRRENVSAKYSHKKPYPTSKINSQIDNSIDNSFFVYQNIRKTHMILQGKIIIYYYYNYVTIGVMTVPSGLISSSSATDPLTVTSAHG